MSDETIRAGDLVAVVRPCCPNYSGGIWIYTVAKVWHRSWRHRCAHCGNTTPAGNYAAETSTEMGVPVAWLKKIHPPEIPETTDEREEMTA